MVSLSWILGHSKTSYTSAPTPIPLKTKSGQKTTLTALAQSSIPPCRLNPFLFNGHLQTMYTAVRDPGPPIFYKRQQFESNHSVYPGQFAVDFVVSKEEGKKAAKERKDPSLPERTTTFTTTEWETMKSDDNRPMLVVLHGLTGGSHEVYLRETVAPLTAAGWAACVVNARGCAMSKITTPHLFNSRATWDVRQTVQTLQHLFPNRPLYGIGFSLGANILTNYCGEEGSSCVLKAAVVCSNPWNLEICNSELLRTWVGLEIYSRTMGRNSANLVAQHTDQFRQIANVDVEAVTKSRYLHEFDRRFQCPTWGYPTIGAYYRDAQCVDALLAVRIPFLGINAEDDPVCLPPLQLHRPHCRVLLTYFSHFRSLPSLQFRTKSSSKTRTLSYAPLIGAVISARSSSGVGGGSQKPLMLSCSKCRRTLTMKHRGLREKRPRSKRQRTSFQYTMLITDD